jgi:hypothetical protein
LGSIHLPETECERYFARNAEEQGVEVKLSTTVGH